MWPSQNISWKKKNWCRKNQFIHDKTQKGTIAVSKTYTIDFYFWPRWINRNLIYPLTLVRKPYRIHNVSQDTAHQETKGSDPWKTENRWALWFTAQFAVLRVSRQRKETQKETGIFPKLKRPRCKNSWGARIPRQLDFKRDMGMV